MNRRTLLAVALAAALAALGMASSQVVSAEATSKKPPPTTTTVTTTTTETETTPPPFLCPDGKPPEANPVNPNDNCERPPVETTTTTETTPPPVVPPVTLQCAPGQIEVSRTATTLVCSETKVITKTIKVPGKKPKPRVVVKRVKFCPKPKPCPPGYVRAHGRCNPQGNG